MAAADRRRGRSPPAAASSSQNPVATISSCYFPPELIPEIASRLTSLQDFFALRAACRAYRALLPLTPSNLASQAPLLLVPHTAAGASSEALFHLPLRRLLRFRIPTARLTAHYDDCGFTRLYYPLGCRVAIYDGVGPRDRRELRILHLPPARKPASLAPRAPSSASSSTATSSSPEEIISAAPSSTVPLRPGIGARHRIANPTALKI